MNDEVVAETIKGHPEVFPTKKAFWPIFRSRGIPRAELDHHNFSPYQKEWIRSSDPHRFLAALSDRDFQSVSDDTLSEVKTRYSEIVGQALDNDPSVFPSSRKIVDVMKRAGYSVGMSSVQKFVDLESLQATWIEKAEKADFFREFTAKSLREPSKPIRRAVRQRLQLEMEALSARNLGAFPSLNRLMELLESEGHTISIAALIENTDLTALQLEWIRSCNDNVLMACVSLSTVNQHPQEILDAAASRTRAIIMREIETHREVFPNAVSIEGILTNSGLELGRNSIQSHIDLPAVQMEWLRNVDDAVFLRNYKKKTFGGVNDEAASFITARMNQIYSSTIIENPDTFPTCEALSNQIAAKYKVKLDHSTIYKNFDIVPAQIDWVRDSSDAIFLEHFRNEAFHMANERCRKAVTERFGQVVGKLIAAHPTIFPSSPAVAEMIGWTSKSRRNNLVAGNVDLAPFQLRWIRGCDEVDFLKAFSKNTFSNISAACKAEAAIRMRKIIIANAQAPESLPISKTTCRRYLFQNPELVFFVAACSDRLTIDQSIVLRMHLWRKGRSDDLHQAIEQRLEQLWGFRELVTLLFDGRCLDARVVSPFHETLPDKAGQYVPSAGITHSFPDSIMEDNFQVDERRGVLLLSFMSWLTPIQSAVMLHRLNLALRSDNEVTLTYPTYIELRPDLRQTLLAFGFEPLKSGTLYLFPSESMGLDEKTYRKLTTESSILTVRKCNEAESVPSKASLFLLKPRALNIGESMQNGKTISYEKEALQNAVPLVTFRDFSSVCMDMAPEVSDILVGKEACILQLKGGGVVGFNVDPKNPYTVEIEGRKFPRGIDRAICEAINGGEGFKVPNEIKEDYRQVLKVIRERREQINKISKTRLHKRT